MKKQRNNYLAIQKIISIWLLIGITQILLKITPGVAAAATGKNSKFNKGDDEFKEIIVTAEDRWINQNDHPDHPNNKDWISSLLDKVIIRQNKRLSFLRNYVSKDQDEKMRTMAFKEQMDKEEIVHLEHEIGQLQEIADSFHDHNEASSRHLISKRQSINNRDLTPVSFTSGKCLLISPFCPHPDKPSDDFICFFVQKTPLPNLNKDQTGVVQFKEAILNLGGAFDLKESAFIAPKSGIYEFNFNGQKTSTADSLYISLRINGEVAVNAWSHFMGHHPGVGSHEFCNPISMHSLLKLKKGDRIDLYNKEGKLDSGIDKDIVQHSRFSGKLLYEDVRTIDKKSNNSLVSKNDKKPLAVYFNAQRSSSYCKIGSIIPFEIVELNIGEVFDLNDNEFICPVAGIYEFIFKGYKTETPTETQISLRLNGVKVAYTFADYATQHDIHLSSSINSILKLEKEDRVSLFLKKGCLYDDSNHLTQFSGKLLMAYNAASSSNSTSTAVDGVYFNVQKNAPFYTSNAVIPFEVMVLNIGGAFKMNGHFFKAPRNGIYEFNVNGIKHKLMNRLYIALRLNEKPVAYVWADYVEKHDYYTPFYLHYVLKLKKGDRIDLFKVGFFGSIYDDNDKHTQFTGKLLFSDDDTA